MGPWSNTSVAKTLPLTPGCKLLNCLQKSTGPQTFACEGQNVPSHPDQGGAAQLLQQLKRMAGGGSQC